MKCTQAQSLMHDFLEHSISDQQLGAFLDHLESCADCREELELYNTVYDSLTRDVGAPAGREAADTHGLSEKLSDARSYLRRKRTGRILTRAIVVVLTVLFLVIFYISLMRPGEAENEPGDVSAAHETLKDLSGNAEPEDVPET